MPISPQQAINGHKQVILMKNISITTYRYKVYLEIKNNIIYIRKT